jgi:hypothetical protein
MSAKDRFHEVVKQALIVEGWQITADPFFLQWGGVDLYVDLAAEKIITATKEGRKIAVEVKSFIGASFIADFHLAIGQYIDYRQALRNKEPDRELYLAIPTDTYKTFFNLPFVQSVVTSQQIQLLVYDVRQEVITTWIP